MVYQNNWSLYGDSNWIKIRKMKNFLLKTSFWSEVYKNWIGFSRIRRTVRHYYSCLKRKHYRYVSSTKKNRILKKKLYWSITKKTYFPFFSWKSDCSNQNHLINALTLRFTIQTSIAFEAHRIMSIMLAGSKSAGAAGQDFNTTRFTFIAWVTMHCSVRPVAAHALKSTENPSRKIRFSDDSVDSIVTLN